jgi:hypothetical protein
VEVYTKAALSGSFVSGGESLYLAMIIIWHDDCDIFRWVEARRIIGSDLLVNCPDLYILVSML